jgi:hypothetical protein
VSADDLLDRDKKRAVNLGAEHGEESISSSEYVLLTYPLGVVRQPPT